MRLLGVGTPKAPRLVRLAGWATPDEPPPDPADPVPTDNNPNPTYERPHLLRNDAQSPSASNGTAR